MAIYPPPTMQPPMTMATSPVTSSQVVMQQQPCNRVTPPQQPSMMAGGPPLTAGGPPLPPPTYAAWHDGHLDEMVQVQETAPRWVAPPEAPPAGKAALEAPNAEATAPDQYFQPELETLSQMLYPPAPVGGGGGGGLYPPQAAEPLPVQPVPYQGLTAVEPVDQMSEAKLVNHRRNIHSRDRRLNTVGEIMSFFRTHNTKPEVSVQVRCHHTKIKINPK